MVRTLTLDTYFALINVGSPSATLIVPRLMCFLCHNHQLSSLFLQIFLSIQRRTNQPMVGRDTLSDPPGILINWMEMLIKLAVLGDLRHSGVTE